ncbi:hypothetical protein [Sorangium sp. So ce1335]|uniref:hypothetical protein n=1 Tax=Sorangium sp. So ce1335 TaxID=3133335 RepID=UPI003F606AE2
MMRTFTLPLVALLTSLVACTGNGPREPSTEPAAPAPPTAPAPPATPAPSAPTAPAPTGDAPTTPASASPSPAASSPAVSGDEALLGSWTSAACGARKYERVLALAQGGTFVAEDRVSPCPPRVACIWSGIIHRKGAFKRSGNTVSLSVTEASHGPSGQPFPTTLTVDPSTDALVEAGDGGAACSYKRAGR